MNVRCPFCNQTFNLARDFVMEALAETEEKGQKYYAVECFHCRKLIKIPLAQMERFVRPLSDISEEGD